MLLHFFFSEVVNLISSREEYFFSFLLLYICRTVSWCISDRPRMARIELSEFLPWASNTTLIVETKNA